MSALRCLGWVDTPCGRPVLLTGGAWCERCRPVDLTGGVSPLDTFASTPPPSRGQGKRVDTDEARIWHRLADEGLSVDEIALVRGEKREVVRRALTRIGRYVSTGLIVDALPDEAPSPCDLMPQPRAQATPAEVREWALLASTGLPFSRIAEIAGRDRKTVKARLAEIGVEEPPRVRHIATPAEVEEWSRRYRGGETLEDIALDACVSRATVRRALVGAGVTLRPAGWGGAAQA